MKCRSTQITEAEERLVSAGLMDRKGKELVCNGNPDMHDVDDLQP